jgi:hypothetical protein
VCGSTIDAPLADGFEVFRVLLGIDGDRGQTASVTVTDQLGRRMYLYRGLRARLAPGPPVLTQNSDGTLNARVPTEKEFRDFIDSRKRKRPGAPINVSNVTVTREFPGPVNINLQFGGDATLRSCAKSALTLVAHKGGPEAGLEPAWRFVATGEPSTVRINFTTAARPWTPSADLGAVPHFVAVVASSHRRSVSMQVRFFGDIAFAGTLASDIDTTDWRYAYVVDPLTGVDDETSDFDDELGASVADALVS